MSLRPDIVDWIRLHYAESWENLVNFEETSIQNSYAFLASVDQTKWVGGDVGIPCQVQDRLVSIEAWRFKGLQWLWDVLFYRILLLCSYLTRAGRMGANLVWLDLIWITSESQTWWVTLYVRSKMAGKLPRPGTLGHICLTVHYFHFVGHLLYLEMKFWILLAGNLKLTDLNM